MKLLIFLNNDVHSAAALKLLISPFRNHKIKIILSQKVGNVEDLPVELAKMRQYEKYKFDWKDFGFEVVGYEDVNSKEALDDFYQFAPDLMISIRFGQIFQMPLILIPRLGVLNLHSGILPKYRGIIATFWAILNGEENIGMTLHYINDERIDAGDVIGFYERKVDPNLTLFTNISSLYEGGCDLLVWAVGKLCSNEVVVTTKQSDLGNGRYFSYPKLSDIEKFIKLMPLF